jgi:hypothetical protein
VSSARKVRTGNRLPILAATAIWAVVACPARAVDVNGSLRGWIGSTKAAGLESDEEDQAFRLALTQELTPYLTIFGSFRANSFRTDVAAATAFERTSVQPEIGLTYDRRRLKARLLVTERAIRTTDETQDLDIQTLLASLDWRPSRGPRIGFRFQDSTSTADAALFGRDTASRNFNFRADYEKASWSARYSLDLTEIDNHVTRLSLEQSRHELRAGYAENLWHDRWSLNLDARFADVSQTQDAPSGAAVALPLPAAQGLYTIDPTPALGELEPAPQLIDGNTATPAAPGVEIGGANTFRNIGLDLGISRPVSQLEITVDAPSGPVIWQIWTSPDNSSWFQVGASLSSFDAGFLRYTIRFSETTTRYLKAVNVSVNPVNEAAVTEVRALLETNQLERSEGSGTEYWLNLQSSLQVTARIELSVVAVSLKNQDLVSTTLRRSYDERGLSVQLRTELSDTLQLRFGYRVSNFEEDVEPVLERREEIASAVLDWRPLETVGVLLTAQQREETDGAEILSATDSLTLQAVTEIFPRLTLNSTLGFADTNNPLFGFTQETLHIIESLEARPNDRWLLAGSLSRYEYDSTGTLAVTARTSAQLRAAWFATPFLSLSGEWLESEDDLGDTTTQRLGVQWAPGPRLSLSTNYLNTESSASSGTSNLSFDGSYRLNRWFRIWLALNEAETRIITQETATTETFRVGINAVF